MIGDRRSRRWPWLVLSGGWVLSLLVAVPIGAWFVGGTLEVGQGGKTPTVAVMGVVGGLSQWSGEDDMNHVLPLLFPDRAGDLLRQLRAMRASLKANGADLEEANTRATLTSAGATVQTDVRARLTVDLADRLPIDVRGDWSTWTFTLVHARGLTHGWKVCTAAVRDPFS